MSARLHATSVLALLLSIAAGTESYIAGELPRGSPERTAALLTLRGIAEADIGVPLEFRVERIDAEGDWVAIVAKPGQHGGPLDWSKTRYAAAVASGARSDTLQALLHRRDERWSVAAYALGAKSDQFAVWGPRFGLPSALVGPSAPAATVAAVPPVQSPSGPSIDAKGLRAQALSWFERFEKSRDPEDWKRGFDAIVSAVTAYTQSADAWRLLAHAYAQGAGHVALASALAEEAYEKAIALEPKNVRTRILLAGLLIDRQSFSRALDNLEAALMSAPDLATSSVVAGMCRLYLIDESGPRGERYLARFVATHPHVPAARLGLAILRHDLGRPAEALPLVEAVARDPTAPAADVEHAELLLRAWGR